jgi:hypothetical protein
VLVRGDADARIAHLEPHAGAVTVQRNAYDAAGGGELDRVGDEVVAQLGEPVGVRPQLRHRLDRHVDRDQAGGGARARQVGRVADERLRVDPLPPGRDPPRL